MRAGAGTRIAHLAGHRPGITARWRRAAAGAAALVLPLSAMTLTAAPASAAVRYLVTHTIPVGGTLWGVAVDSATHTACVANGQTRAVSVIDEASDTVTRTIPAGTSTYGLALDPAARVSGLPGAAGRTREAAPGLECWSWTAGGGYRVRTRCSRSPRSPRRSAGWAPPRSSR